MAIPTLPEMGGTGWSLRECACDFNPELTEQARAMWQVVCDRCGRRGPITQAEWMAVELWNKDRSLQQSTTNQVG